MNSTTTALFSFPLLLSLLAPPPPQTAHANVIMSNTHTREPANTTRRTHVVDGEYPVLRSCLLKCYSRCSDQVFSIQTITPMFVFFFSKWIMVRQEVGILGPGLVLDARSFPVPIPRVCTSCRTNQYPYRFKFLLPCGLWPLRIFVSAQYSPQPSNIDCDLCFFSDVTSGEVYPMIAACIMILIAKFLQK